MTMTTLPAMRELVERLRRLPYLSTKNVYKVACHILALPEQDVADLVATIKSARKMINKCQECANLTQNSTTCSICADPNRDKSVVCVVETWHDLNSIDRSGEFKGLFHVLGGSICPLEGIGPEELNITKLIQRAQSGQIKELILATNLTPEGEVTSSFISSKLIGSSIKITRLASGIPMGSTLEFMDRVTILKAMEGRTPF